LDLDIGCPRLRSLLRASIIDLLSARARSPLVVGICGAQGSGKSTLAREITRELSGDGLAVATLSLDDLYRTRAERKALGRDVHPLLETRGVPGTHDVSLGLSLLADIDAGKEVLLPRFDKSADDRLPADRWEPVPQPLDLLILEGWCVGARPQEKRSLVEPINALEREQDRDATWRFHVNRALADDYRQLFARIDYLILLAAPDWDVVLGWRLQQEHELRQEASARGSALMDDAQVARFVQHYERLTRHILDEMPGRADLTIALDRDRSWRGTMSDLKSARD
jgi:D-glycerate 3-kinase